MANWVRDALPQIRDELRLGDIYKRHTSAIHFRGLNGKRTAVIQIQPIFRRDTNHKLVPIDTALQEGAGGFWGVPGSKFQVNVDGRAKIGLYESKFANLSSVRGLVSGNQMIREFPPFGKEIYELRERHLKHTIILDKIPPSAFVGEVLKTGTLPKGIIESPIVCFDAGGDVYVHDGNFGHFRSWMVNAKYPVTIDPTFSDQPDETDGTDTYIHPRFPTANYETQTSFITGDPTASFNDANRALVKFDVSSLSGVVVDDVTESFYEVSANSSGAPTTGDVEAYLLLQNWLEASATWNKYSGSNWDSAGASTVGTDRSGTLSASVAIDDTAAADFLDWTGSQLDQDYQDFIDGTKSNYGHIFINTREFPGTAEYAYNIFNSAANGVPSSRPKLVINYSVGSAASNWWRVAS